MFTMRRNVGIVWGIFLFCSGVARAQLAPPTKAPGDESTERSNGLASDAAKAEIAGDYPRALRLAEQAIAADANDPWAHYDNATALAAVGRVDDAIPEFKLAERRFSAEDRWGHSVAIYGRAHAFSEARRCVEARAAFEEYAQFVASEDQRSAEMARSYAAGCTAGSPGTATPAR